MVRKLLVTRVRLPGGARRRAGIGGETVEVVGCVSQRHAAVARRVFVPALETLAGVAEQERPRRHQVAPEGRPVLKGAAHDDPDRHRRVPFFKRTVPRPARIFPKTKPRIPKYRTQTSKAEA